MKKNFPWIAAGVVAFALLALGQGEPQQKAPATPSEQMDTLFDFWNRLDQPGFAVVVVKDGQVAYRNVFGLACQEHAAAIGPNTVFNTATLAQVFVGQAVAMLEEQGKLSLEEDVRKYVPEVPDFGTPLKLRHLVFQCSGLRDWLPVLRLTGRDKQEVTIETVLDIVKAQKSLVFPPGDRFQNSGTNYDLLAEVVRRATGKPFSDWAWENMFRPLKMTRTQFRDNARSIFDDEALTYNFTRKEYLRGIDNLSLAGSHSLFTSVADLAKWLMYIEAGPEDGQKLFAKMSTAGALNNGRPSPFAYGLNAGVRAGKRAVFQTGTWAGSGAVLVYLPDQKLGFAVLANWDYTPVDGFTEDIIGIFAPSPAPPPPPAKAAAAPAKPAVKVSPDKLDAYAGDYRIAPGQLLTIRREGGQLYLAVPGQKFALTTQSETEFLFDLAQAQIVFQREKDGRVRQFVWKQGGTDRIVPKVVLVKPTADELAEFAGAYLNEELGLLLNVEVKGGALALQPSGQAEVRFAPDEQDHFTSGQPNFPMIVFRRDDRNRVVGLVIDSDAVRDLVFTRR